MLKPCGEKAQEVNTSDTQRTIMDQFSNPFYFQEGLVLKLRMFLITGVIIFCYIQVKTSHTRPMLNLINVLTADYAKRCFIKPQD